jgi:hypothetical protein
MNYSIPFSIRTVDLKGSENLILISLSLSTSSALTELYLKMCKMKVEDEGRKLTSSVVSDF